MGARNFDNEGQEQAGERWNAVGGRQPAPFVMLPIWVMHAAGPKAQALYSIFAAEVFHSGSRKVDPTREQLAALMGFSPRRPQSVDPYIRELESIGAIYTVRGKTPDGLKDRNTYVVHHDPPDSYTGPRTYGQFYRERVAGEAEPSGAAAAVRSSAQRAEQREEGKTAGRADVRKTAQRAEQREEGKTAGRADVRKTAQRAQQREGSVSAGRADVRETAHTLRTKKEEVRTPSTPLRSVPTGAAAEAQGGGDQRQGNPDHGPLVAEILRVRPDWFARDVKKALNDPEVSSRDPELVRAALLVVAKMPDTKHPSRLTQSGPWWAQAAAQVAKPARRAMPGWCGECDGDDRTCETDKGELFHCPRCNPLSPAYAPEGAQK
ncbi:hypothetical protein [Microtetraspora malaysiensis]|uniref:hypothetical protein n=1 Tax=Microtetraspora malaysiensis TaxID=161358 RepID=UPI003D935550